MIGVRTVLRSPLLWVFLLSYAGLLGFPVWDCVGCEGGAAWEQDAAAYERNGDVLNAGYLVCALIAGYSSLARYWPAPFCILCPYVLTQPSWQDGIAVSLLLGLPAAAVGLFTGFVVRLAVRRLT
ncbi:MAG TPA: hypothetical protein VFQ91_16750 [Bryobacteraceae bacterium]|nr:hypothetical protein [Bryobacteraceae bacterium]